MTFEETKLVISSASPQNIHFHARLDRTRVSENSERSLFEVQTGFLSETTEVSTEAWALKEGPAANLERGDKAAWPSRLPHITPDFSVTRERAGAPLNTDDELPFGLT